MAKVAPSPTSAILTDGVYLTPNLIVVLWTSPEVPTAVSAAARFLAHEAQAPPGPAVFLSSVSLRAPPAFLA